MHKLGKRLKELRGNLSFYEVGKITGMSHGNFSKYEQGAVLPSRATLRKLANCYEVPYQELFELYLEDTYPEKDERNYIKAWVDKH